MTSDGGVLRGAELLAKIGGGVTIQPPVEGGWLDEDAGRIIWERPVILFTYVRPDEFEANLAALRVFLHALGRETRQGEVAFEFDREFHRIQVFDEP